MIIINKCDIADNSFVKELEEEYYFLKRFIVSALNITNLDDLIKYVENSVCAVCGQSAVGKSTLINSLIPKLQLQTQGLSDKIDRGKHTTRVNELYIYNNLKIIDTPGFSSLELDIDYDELVSFYPEFDKYLGECRYQDCSHIKEGNDCVIITAVENEKINKNRYDRFVTLYNKLKEKWEKKYD